MAPNDGPKRRVGVFWDVENCQIPSDMPGHEVALRIKSAVRPFGDLVELNAYGDTYFCRLISRKLVDLRRTGVHFIETPHDAKKQVADMRIIADIVAFAFSQVSPATVVLISNDGDFAHAVSLVQDKGHTVWLISSDTHTSDKLIALIDGKMSWRWDVLGPPLPLAGSSSITHSTDKDVRSLDEEHIMAHACHNTFPIRFGQIPSSLHFPIPNPFCQTSSSSFSASGSMRSMSIQTCSPPVGQSDSNSSSMPLSIITSSVLNSDDLAHEPKVAPAKRIPDTNSSSTACSTPKTLVSPVSIPPAPPARPVVPSRVAPSVRTKPPVPVHVSAPDPTPRRAPPPTNFAFRELINLLRNCDAHGCKMRVSKVVRWLTNHESALLIEHKGLKRYLDMAQAAGVILMDRREKGLHRFIRLHPDYH